MESSHPSQALQPRRSGRGGIVTLISGYRPHRYPKVTATLLLWLLGLWFMLLAKPLYQPSEEEVKAFEAKLKEASGGPGIWASSPREVARAVQYRARYHHRPRVRGAPPAAPWLCTQVESLDAQVAGAYKDWVHQEAEIRDLKVPRCALCARCFLCCRARGVPPGTQRGSQSSPRIHQTQPAPCPRSLQVWFWRWREPHRERVLARQPAVDAAKARVEELQTQQEKLFSDAKAQLGLWSEAGVGESRQLFWWVLPHAVVLAGCSTVWG